jgi:sugar lactone lactonase YvrE
VAEPTSRSASRPTSVAEEDVADPTPLPAPTTVDLPAIDLPAIELPALPELPAAEDDMASVTLRFGGEGTGPGRFASPRGVAIDREGNLYVSDYTTGRVQKFDSEGRPLLSWISAGETPVLALAADREGGVYVVRNTEAQKYDSEGNLLGAITDAAGGGFSDLIVLSDGSMLAIPWASADVVRLDAEGREVERLESLLEERARANTRPSRLAADGVGTFYVLGGSGTDVFVFSRDGQFVDRFSVPGAWAFSDIAVDAAGRVFVSTHMEGVRVFAADGQELGSIRAPVSAFDLKFDDANHLLAVTALSEVLRLHLAEE